MSEELLPCPFCGEELIESEDHHGKWMEHRNTPKHDCFIGYIGVYDESNAKQWNTRAPLWQPIETAPRDAEIVAGYYYSSSLWCQRVVAWKSKSECFTPYAKYTHWMPIPPPPTD